MKIPHLPAIEKRLLTTIVDERPATLLTTEPVWDQAKKLVNLKVGRKIFVDDATKDYMDGIVQACDGEIVYGIGGGLAIDAAKYVAAHHDLPLIAVPTVLSTDAFLTNATGVRMGGCVRYLPTKPPDLVVIDMEALCNAPPAMRAAGAADVLSIATGMWDWQESERLGENPSNQRVTPHVVEIGKAILQSLLNNAREIGRGTERGLTMLLDLLCMEVQLCYLCEHSRVEEGSEHYFVYALENRLTEHALHGNLVGLGILLMASLQSQGWQRYRYALEHLRIDYRPSAETHDMVVETLINLSDYVRQHRLPYSILTDLTITRALAEATMRTVLV